MARGIGGDAGLTAGRGGWTAAALFVALCAVGVGLSDVPLLADDIGYVGWALQHRDEPSAVLRGSWSPHWRPLFTAVWWLGAQVSIDGVLVRGVQIALWAATAATVAVVAARRGGSAALGLALVLFNPVYADLLQWKSWLTTTGTLFGLVLGLAALDRGRRGAMAAAGALALGFKETGALVLGVAGLAPSATRIVGAALVAAAVLAASAATHKLGGAYVADNALTHLRGLGGMAWSLPLLSVVAAPRLPDRWRVATALAVVLPDAVAGALVVGAVLAAAARSAGTLWAVAAAWLVPLFGSHAAQQYLLEGWLVAAARLAWRPGTRVAAVVWLAALVACVPVQLDHLWPRAAQRAAAAEQREFLRWFRPEPAARLYHPDPDASWGLDTLVWLSMGATWAGAPPEGATPRRIGPVSGVWADLATSEERARDEVDGAR